MGKSLLDDILEKYGEDAILRKPEGNIPAISTGALSLDVSIGIGGIPIGRITEIYGPESSGKTTLALSVVNQTLRLPESRILYIDTENSLDYGYLSSVIDKEFHDQIEERVLVVQPKSGEDALEIAEAGVDARFNLIVFDSIAALSPEKELEDPFDKDHIGLVPRLASKFLRRKAVDIRRNSVAFLAINQVRANIGSFTGGFTTPVGHAFKHWTSVRVFVVATKKIRDKEDEIGREVKFTIQKNKVAIPYRTAYMPLIYGKGFDYYRDVVGFANLLGVVKTRGAYYSFEEETIGQGIVKAAEELEQNQELLDKIVKACYNVAGSVSYASDFNIEKELEEANAETYED